MRIRFGRGTLEVDLLAGRRFGGSSMADLLANLLGKRPGGRGGMGSCIESSPVMIWVLLCLISMVFLQLRRKGGGTMGTNLEPARRSFGHDSFLVSFGLLSPVDTSASPLKLSATETSEAVCLTVPMDFTLRSLFACRGLGGGLRTKAAPCGNGVLSASVGDVGFRITSVMYWILCSNVLISFSTAAVPCAFGEGRCAINLANSARDVARSSAMFECTSLSLGFVSLYVIEIVKGVILTSGLVYSSDSLIHSIFPSLLSSQNY